MKPTNEYYENLAMQRITEALLKLMEKYPFNEISILQITQEAQMARRTFYVYFDTKYDILTNYYTVLTKEYLANMSEKAKESISEELEYFFSFWYRHRGYLKLLYDQGLFHILMNRFSDYLSRDGKIYDEEVLNTYIIPYTSGGLWATLYTWTQRDFIDSPENIAGWILQFQKIKTK